MCFYHFDGPERQQVVVLLAVAPGVPARILALLQDVHLAAEVHLLEAHVPAGRADSVSSFREQNFEERLFESTLTVQTRRAESERGRCPAHIHSCTRC